MLLLDWPSTHVCEWKISYDQKMKPIHFGQPDRPLFGVYHQAMGANAGAARAVLICPPIGQEYIRTHWTLRLAASQLSRKGIHVFRFDYAGLGDSWGSIKDVRELAMWQADLVAAANQLRELSGAFRVTTLGMRAGAMLAASVANQHSELIQALIHWEPIESGRSLLDEQRRMHAKMIDLWVCRMKTVNNDESEELLGSVYDRNLMRQLENWHGEYSNVLQPQLIYQLATHPLDFQPACPYATKRVTTQDEYSWNQLSQLETALLRTQTLREVVAGAIDLHDRLERFELMIPGDNTVSPETSSMLPVGV